MKNRILLLGMLLYVHSFFGMEHNAYTFTAKVTLKIVNKTTKNFFIVNTSDMVALIRTPINTGVPAHETRSVSFDIVYTGIVNEQGKPINYGSLDLVDSVSKDKSAGIDFEVQEYSKKTKLKAYFHSPLANSKQEILSPKNPSMKISYAIVLVLEGADLEDSYLDISAKQE